jgi:hypothetical protein
MIGGNEMTLGPLDESQRKAAVFAGMSYLVTFVIVFAVNFAIQHPMIVANDPGATSRNILEHERLFRIGIAGDILYCVGLFALLAALYVILKPVNRGLALLAAFWRLIWVVAWLVMTFNLFDVLRLVVGAGYLSALGDGGARALALLELGERSDYYYVGLLFGGLASAVCSYLWFKSRYIPRMLAVYGLVASLFCAACTLVFFIFPGFEKIVSLGWFDTPMGLFDIVLSFWLLIRGLRPYRTAETGTASA